MFTFAENIYFVTKSKPKKMKKLASTLLVAVLSCFSVIASTFNAPSETITFKVNGQAACKNQIETLITGIDGVSSAVWDATTHKITIVYDSAVVKKDRFYVTLAEGGYDNEQLHAKKNNYDALSAECKYVREPEKD